MTIGLALSGGGFRATLFHLGVIRYLRDAGRLKDVNHICSVSRGSVLAAHLVLNWESYSGSQEQFEDAEKEVLVCTKRDIRGRILRRLMFLPATWLIPRRLRSRLNIPASRIEMFRSELDRQLFHGAHMHDLPNRPRLEVLATNMANGRLCAFTKNGVSVDKNGDERLLESVNVPVSLAVSASASFPGMFPPALIDYDMIGVTKNEFPDGGRLILTDGGVFDNLAVRQLAQFAKHAEKAGSARDKLDLMIVSDAGGEFNEKWFRRWTGLWGTALRAADILMNRIHHLEQERMIRESHTAPDSEFLTISISETLESTDQKNALEPAVQHHVNLVRTDLDRFSNEEREAVISHGYAISHKRLFAKLGVGDESSSSIKFPRCSEAPDRLVRILQSAQYRKFRLISRYDWILVPQLIASLLAVWLALTTYQTLSRPIIEISGKNFTESTLLVEIMAQMLEPDFRVRRNVNEPESEDLFENLLDRKTDMYADYSGTVLAKISHLRNQELPSVSVESAAQLNKYLQTADLGGRLVALESFGFENPFVLVMLRENAESLGFQIVPGSLPTISELAKKTESHPGEPIQYGFSNRFSERTDCWPNLEKRYVFSLKNPKVVEHNDSYTALHEDKVDVVIGYRTDPQLRSDKYVQFVDDRNAFPSYKALPLIRADTLNDYPKIALNLREIAGKITEERMFDLVVEADRRLDAACRRRPGSPLDSQERLTIISPLVDKFLAELAVGQWWPRGVLPSSLVMSVH